MEVSLGYTFDEDGLIRLQKDLNHLLNNLNDQNVKSIRTEYCRVSSKGGETIINGALLEMFDYNNATSQASTTLRLRAGYNKGTSNFEFSLWNSISTTPTLQLDSIGNAVFSGNINTSNSLIVGNNIFLGQTGSTVEKGLYFNATNPTTSEAEGSSDMKSALYTYLDSSGGLVLNLNTTHEIDMIGLNAIFIGRNRDFTMSTAPSLVVSTSNYLTHYAPHVVLGDQLRHTVFLGNNRLGTEWATTNVVEGKGYVDNAHFILSDYVKSCWNEQGKNLDEFQSTVGWTPNALCYVDATASSTNQRCIGTNGLTLVNNTTASGDVQIYKMYSDFNGTYSNGGRNVSTNMLFYVLMYVYDLNLINTLSTKAFQVELASSSGAGDKLRWLLGGSTTASTLTTGWNFITQRLGYGYYYTSTLADMSSIKYMRLSFEVKANSSGRIATFQSFGFLTPTSSASTSPIAFPRYDDLHYGGWWRESLASMGGTAKFIMRRVSSTGIGIVSCLSLLDGGTSGTLFPTIGYSYGNDHQIRQEFNSNCKMQYTLVCRNDKGNLPAIGGYLDLNTDSSDYTGYFYVFATSHLVKLKCNYNSTDYTDTLNLMTIGYGDEFKVTLWKEDPKIYNDLVGVSQITAMIEKIGTTQAYSFSYIWENCIWKKARYVPFIAPVEVNSGAEIRELIATRR